MLQLVVIHIKALLDERHIYTCFLRVQYIGILETVEQFGMARLEVILHLLHSILFQFPAEGGRLRRDASCSGSELQVCHQHHHR